MIIKMIKKHNSFRQKLKKCGFTILSSFELEYSHVIHCAEIWYKAEKEYYVEFLKDGSANIFQEIKWKDINKI